MFRSLFDVDSLIKRYIDNILTRNMDSVRPCCRLVRSAWRLWYLIRAYVMHDSLVRMSKC